MSSPRDTLAMSGPLAFFAFGERIRPGSMFSAANTMRRTYEVTGPIDAERLAAGAEALGLRHRILWTSLCLDLPGEPRLSIEDPGPVPVDMVVDQSESASCGRYLRSVRIDPRHAPLARVLVHRLGSDKHWVSLVVHHIAADPWSMDLYLETLSDAYLLPPSQGETAGSRGHDYIDLLREEQVADDSGRSAASESFWREYLANLPRLHIPTDRPRDDTKEPVMGCASQMMVDTIWSEVRELAKRLRVTPFLVLLSAFSFVVASKTGENDLVIPTFWSGRERAELRDIAGPMMNPLVLRLDVTRSHTVQEAVAGIRSSVFQTYPHAWTPIDRVAGQVPEAAEILADPEAVRMMFQFIPGSNSPVSLFDLQTVPVDLDPGSVEAEEPFPQDLAFTVFQQSSRLLVEVNYDANLFAASTIREWINAFENGILKMSKGLSDTVEEFLTNTPFEAS